MKSLNQINLRVKGLFFSVSFLLFCTGMAFSANGQDANLVGTWVINQVKIKKMVNDVSSEKTYSMKQRFASFIDCPQKITFTADKKVIFEYYGKKTSEDTYSVEGNKIKRETPIAGYEYEYSIIDNKIQIYYIVSYLSHYTDGTDWIKEEYTLYGTKE